MTRRPLLSTRTTVGLVVWRYDGECDGTIVSWLPSASGCKSSVYGLPGVRPGDSLRVSPFPVLVTDAGPVPAAAAAAGAPEHLGGVTVAVQAECAACGHWMLFNSLKFRTGQERIMLLEVDEDEQGRPEE